MRRLIAAAMIAWTPALTAQGNPGQNIRTEFRVLDIARTGDTTTVTLRIVVDRASKERLSSFTIFGTGTPLMALGPEPLGDWHVMSEFRGRVAASWAPLGANIVPGDSSPPVRIKGIGLPGVSVAWIQGDALPDEALGARLDSIFYAAYPDSTRDALEPYVRAVPAVGIDPAPHPATREAHAGQLRELSASSCTHGWISDARVCAALRVFSGGPARTTEYLAALESGHRSGAVNSLAYWMLKVRAEAIGELRAP